MSFLISCTETATVWGVKARPISVSPKDMQQFQRQLDLCKMRQACCIVSGVVRAYRSLTRISFYDVLADVCALSPFAKSRSPHFQTYETIFASRADATRYQNNSPFTFVLISPSHTFPLNHSSSLQPPSHQYPRFHALP